MDSNVITENIAGTIIKLKTRPGVFSKDGIDHGSRLLLEHLDLSKIPDKGLVADLGCGSGVVGLTLAKLLPRVHIHLLDVNLRAVELAKENAIFNNLKNTEVYLSDQFSATEDRSYHLIISNPSQHLGNEFLEEMARQCLSHLKKNGEVYWVVQKHLQPYLKRLFENTFKEAKIVSYGREHVLIKGVKGGN